MAGTQIGASLRHLQKFFSTGIDSEVADDQLIQRFVAARDESAFETLLERHGPMVLSVCRGVLGEHRHTRARAGRIRHRLGSGARAVRPVPRFALANWISRIRQDLFYPPNVGGWPAGRAWLSTHTLVARANFAHALIGGRGVGLPGPIDAAGPGRPTRPGRRGGALLRAAPAGRPRVGQAPADRRVVRFGWRLGPRCGPARPGGGVHLARVTTELTSDLGWGPRPEAEPSRPSEPPPCRCRPGAIS